ncbi:RHS repeat-associated core domain-containing protein [Capnocytophaga ochracea]|nr:RHS repeat-associated core domain-containing protein [Capnocytophaga ochracea]
MLKHYSHDGSVEIVCNKTDNSTKFVFYLGGNAYSAPAILISDGETSKLYYLHRDYLGSIVMLTDENGNIAECRHFDAWGQPIKVADGAGNTLDKLTLLDRGFTGHEHLQTVELIHMNGRLYDPALHRFLQPDNYVQDPFNTQNFNRYGYCLNNPLVYVDENGEFIITALIVGAIIGAYIGGSQANGTYKPFKWDFNNVEAWGGIVGGGIIGCLSEGVAAYAGGLAVAGLVAYGITGGVIGGAVVGATSGLVGGFISGGFMSQLPGGNGKFWSCASWGALSGFIGGAVLGGATGALTTPKGHNIWTGREIQQPVQTLEGAPINIDLEANNLDGLSLQEAKNQIKQAISDNGEPIKYRAEYIKKVTGLDVNHNWNKETIEIVADHGKIFNSVGGDGSKEILIQMLGEKYGVDGVYEIIIRDGVITHQRFIENGVINGIYNQKGGGVGAPRAWWK